MTAVSITGYNTNAIAQIAPTFGTAVAGGASDKLCAEITPNFNINEIKSRQIGSGAFMISSIVRGSYAPTLSITMDTGFRNNADKLVAQMLGTDTTSAEITGGQGDYSHTLTFNSTLNGTYVTIAFEDASTTVQEYPSCAVRSIGFKSTSIPGLVDFTAELLANDVTLTTAINTNAVLAASTLTDTELATADFSSIYWQGSQSSGSLSSSNKYNIVSFDLSLSRPQEMVAEIRGASGNSAPIGTGLFEGNFNIVARELIDHTYYTIWTAGTLQKALLEIDGTAIGSGSNKAWKMFMPGMKLVQEPKYALTSEGTNQLSFAYPLLKAASAPTGMSSVYPYFVIYNTLSTSLLA